MKKINKNKKAFTMLEMVVVLFVASIGLLAILSLSVNSLRAQSLNKNTSQASFLAEECLELLKQKRLDYYIQKIADYNFAPDPDIFNSGEENTFILDSSGLYELYDDAYPNTAWLYLDSNNFYQHDDSYPLSIFRRVLTLNYASDDSYIEAECRVDWEEKGQSYNYILKTYLYDWLDL